MLGRYMLFFAVAAAMLMHVAGAFSLPANTLYYVNVSLQNTQTTATGNYLQVMIPFNALAYSSYEASNLQNIEFSYSNNGTVADTWLEGNGLNETKATSLSSSANIIYWVKLNPSIAASSTAADVLTIDFVSTATNLFNGNTVGVAPQLSPTYAEYDDGSSVFDFYANAASMSSWIPSGSAGVTNSAPTGSPIGSTVSYYAVGSVSDYLYSNAPNLPANDFIIDYYAYTPKLEDVFFDTTSNGYGQMLRVGNGNGLFGTTNTNSWTSWNCPPGSISFSNAWGLVQEAVNPSGSPLLSIWWNPAPVLGLQGSPTATIGGGGSANGCTGISNVQQFGTYIGLVGDGGGGTQYYQLLLVRAYPPNGVMPTATFGPVTSAQTLPTLTITPNPTTYGQSITLTATCTVSTDTCAIDYPSLSTVIATGIGTATYTYKAFALAAGSYSSFYANDITTGLTSAGQTLTVNKNSTYTFNLTSCGTQAYPYTCTTTGKITTWNNQLIADLYLNDSFLGSTNTVISDTVANQIGRFTYIFTTSGDANYSSNGLLAKYISYVPIDLYYANSTTSQILQTLTPNGIDYLDIPACTNNFLSGTCSGNIAYTADSTLQGNIIAFGSITIDSGVTLTENGFHMLAVNNFTNNGIITGGMNPNVAGGSGGYGSNGGPGTSIVTSYAGSGGGGGGNSSNTYIGGGGGNTVVSGGTGGTSKFNAGNGLAPNAPLLTPSLAASIFGNVPAYLSSASGGGGGSGACCGGNGGGGVYGVAIGGSTVIAGTINTTGIAGGSTGSGDSGGGGGGAGSILILYMNSYIPGTYTTSGGTGGTGVKDDGGLGGNGIVMDFAGSLFPLLPSTHTFFYPLKVNATTANSLIEFNLTVKNWSMPSDITPSIRNLVQNTSLYYLPAASRPTTYLSYDILERQQTNMIWLNLSYFILNMTTIPLNALTYNSPVIQYFPNLATISSWNAKPTSWSIKSDLPINQHSNTSAGEIFSNANLTFVPQITAVYPFTTVTLNATDIGEGTLNQDTFKMIESNTIPSAPYTRVINNVTGYDQQFKSTKLVTNFTISAVYLFNNYQFSNATAFTANNVKLYIGQSNFQNPSITQSSLSIIASDAAPGTHYDAVNSFCPSTIAYGTFRNFNIYSANSNASLYTFSVYSGFQLIPAGTYMTVMSGITNSTAIAVQTVKIASNPFSVPLENGAPYAFHFFNCSASVYTTNFSVWGNPITITLPTSFKAPYYPVPSPNASCGEQPYVGNSMSIVCSGNDPLNYVDAWEITVYNHTSPLSRNILNKSILHGSSFAFTYQPVANSLSTGAQYQVVIIADVGNVIDPQFSVLSWFSPASFTVLPKVAANAWVAVLMVLSALAIGSRSPAMALTFEMAVIFLLPTMNILPISIGVVYGLIALGALSAFIVAKRYFYQ